MRSVSRFVLVCPIVILLATAAWPQASEICGDIGAGSVWLSSKVVYGKVTLTGVEDRQKQPPKVAVILMNGARIVTSTVVDKSGAYCFRDTDGNGSTLIVEVEGREVGRDVLGMAPSNQSKQFRRDFEIQWSGAAAGVKPAVISAKHPYTRNDSNSRIYADAENALNAKDYVNAERSLKEVTKSDPGDFWAWAKLGSIYLERKDLPEAEKAFKNSLDVRRDFAPAMISLGRVYLLQQRFEPAIEVLGSAVKFEPNAARAFQLLGEAYLMVKKGTLGAEALNEALRLDPVAMAECHLLLALLYDRAGIRHYASREYRMFLEKVPDHPDSKKFAKYIKENPDVP